jgi:uncharacterized protein (TIGR02588 family)
MSQTKEPRTNEKIDSDTIAPPWVKRSLAEWITFSIATCILIALIGLVLYDWFISQNRPPVLRVEPYGTIRVVQGQFYQPFLLANTGGGIAKSVQVVAELRIPNAANETGEQQIDFLSGGEKKRGSFVFSHDPRQGELILRVASYKLP